MPISGVKLSDFLEPNFAISETSKVDNNCLHVVLARGARYAMTVSVCMHVCVSVCLSSSIYRKSDVQIFFTEFSMHFARGRGSVVLYWWRYHMLYTSGLKVKLPTEV